MGKGILKIGILVVLMLRLPMVFALSAEEACRDNGIDYGLAQSLVSQLQKALRADDKTAIAGFISYPLRINTRAKDGKIGTYYIKDKSHFFAKYPMIFSADNKNKMLNSTEIFCNYQGAMLGNGFIWFNTTAGAKIFAINLSREADPIPK